MTEFISAAWPIFVGFLGVVVVIAQLEIRVRQAEEKIKTLFNLVNAMSREGE